MAFTRTYLASGRTHPCHIGGGRGREQTADQAKSAAAAYEAAFAMTIPPAVVTANRAQLAALVATNLLGPEHCGDRGHRGPVRGNVGPRCRSHVRLCGLLGGRRGGDIVQLAARDRQPGRDGRPGWRGCPGHQCVDGERRAVDAVAGGFFST